MHIYAAEEDSSVTFNLFLQLSRVIYHVFNPITYH